MRVLMSYYDNFNRWYKEPLTLLYSNADAGFPILMITLPLLERYLREKTGIYEELGVNRPEFNKALMAIFPGLPSEQIAAHFWKVFRHGLCHQATLRELPELHFAGLNNDAPDLHVVNAGSFLVSFMVSPVKFSQKVIQEIETNFGVFEGKGSPQHSLPEIF